MRNYSYGSIANVTRARTKFPAKFSVKTSLNVGDLVPLKCIEVLPGDTWKMKCATVSRISSAFLRPVMDNLYMDVHFFFVPYRLVFEDTEKVFGNANPSQYTDPTFAEFPTLPACTITGGTVGDYLGIPPGSYPEGISVMKFRAFALIYDKWFRKQSIIDEMVVQRGEYKSSEAPNDNDWAPNNYTGKLPKVAKNNDLFTACLPKPQKGLASGVPINANFPVYASTADVPVNLYSLGSEQPVTLKTFSTVGDPPRNEWAILGANGYVGYDSDGFQSFKSTEDSFTGYVWPSNLWAKGDNVKIDVNDMRFAFALQKALELDARAGSRYNEYLLARYSVVNPDARLQLPEYLGGGRMPIHIQQVAQTSSSTEDSALGEVGAFSLSNGFAKFSKAFTEFGFIFAVGAVKQVHTYQQGIDKSWFRTKREDFFDPLFAHIGEQPIYREQIYANGITEFKDTVFGYNEYGAEYRYIPSEVTGQMRSSSGKSLDIWHFADKFANAPTLSKAFVEENADNVDRTIAVPSESLDNFLLDIAFKGEMIRVMPLYSTPGLIDH